MATAGAEPIAQLDTDLVRRALEGDNTAFDLLVVRYQRRIAALARGCGMRLHVGLDRFYAERRFEAPEPQGGGRSPDGDRRAAATEVVVAG